MTEADAIYDDPRLVVLYDLQNGPGPDTQFYLALPDRPGLDILDLGCGTGMLAVDFAEAGHRVTGIDPARAMLAKARSRPGAASVTWIEGTAGAARGPFDLAIMTGHAFQVLLTEEAALETLVCLRRSLRSGGRLAFESRNPAAQAWLGWTPERTRRYLDSDFGRVAVEEALLWREGSLVAFESRHHFEDGSQLISRSTLRFSPRETLGAWLEAAGFGAVDWFGDWDRSPFRPDSREIIVVAQA
jgi:SAM-dependent methyltransferase